MANRTIDYDDDGMPPARLKVNMNGSSVGVAPRKRLASALTDSDEEPAATLPELAGDDSDDMIIMNGDSVQVRAKPRVPARRAPTASSSGTLGVASSFATLAPPTTGRPSWLPKGKPTSQLPSDKHMPDFSSGHVPSAAPKRRLKTATR